jgi:hypothetical protein
MRLSELLREGAKLRPQSFYAYFRFPFGLDKPGDSCALGAIYEALTGSINLNGFRVTTELKAKFPELIVTVENPMEEGEKASLALVIARLNDNGGWTREEIAEWLEGQGF